MKDTVKKFVTTGSNTSELVLVRTLSMGILVNLEGSKLSTAHGDLVVPMVTTLAEVLGIDVLAVLLQNNAEVSSVCIKGSSGVGDFQEMLWDFKILMLLITLWKNMKLYIHM